MMERWLVVITVVTVTLINHPMLSWSDPQVNLLNKACSQYNVTNPKDFHGNLNLTFSDLRAELDNGKHFATAQQVRSADPVYVLVQCRNYLSTDDCIACFAAASSQIRNCSSANGARVVYDGCILRYESVSFYDQGTLLGNTALCRNKTTASDSNSFDEEAQGLLADLRDATPKINGFYAASKKEVVVGGAASVYGVAQCAETVSQSGCQDCLKVAYDNIQRCPPATDGRAIDAGCFMRYSETSFFADNQTTNIRPYLGEGGNSTNKKVIGGVVGGGGLLLLIIVTLLWYRLSVKPQTTRTGDILGATELQGPVNYKYKDLKNATNSFSEENKLGEGGFGQVYKGILGNEKIVAVKKLLISQSNKAMALFETEVKLISNVHHRNLIRLLGCCSKGPEQLLVYEYMANSSLDNFLFGERQGTLNWKQLFDIIVGTAKGLAYLHEEFHVCIIHRDIKSNNILLDDDFQPKIADFGLVRLLPEDQSHLSTKFAGTLGYTAPEYAIHGQLSEKVDVYSYGVVILESITGQRSNEMDDDSGGDYLLKRAWKLYENGAHLELVEKSLAADECRAEDVMKVIEIALMCTQSQASLRPTMSEVVVMLLSKGLLEHPPPTRPAFVELEGNVRIPTRPKRPANDSDTSTSTGSASKATASISELSGR